MSALDDLYQLRSEFEENIRTLFAAQEIAAVTRANWPVEFQQFTPRVEIKCAIGPATGHRFPCPDGTARFDRWRFNLAIQVVTRPSNDGQNALHEVLIGRIRNNCSTLAQSTWGDISTFPNIRIAEPLRDSGDSSTLRTQDGCEYTTVGFSGILCIRESAWPPADAAPAPAPGNALVDTGGNEILDTGGNPILGF